MGWRLLADVMFVLHAAFLLFFVLGGFLAWRWPKVVWAHLAVVAWSLAIVIVDYDCPLTGAEKYFLRRGGEEIYPRGYISHYLDGTIWPEGAAPIAEKVGFALIVISYVGFFVLRSRRRSRVGSVKSPT